MATWHPPKTSVLGGCLCCLCLERALVSRNTSKLMVLLCSRNSTSSGPWTSKETPSGTRRPVIPVKEVPQRYTLPIQPSYTPQPQPVRRDLHLRPVQPSGTRRPVIPVKEVPQRYTVPIQLQSVKTEVRVEDAIAKAIAKARAAHVQWKEEEEVADVVDVPLFVARNVIALLKEGCTIPFIVRYRKEMTDGLEADEVREIQEAYEEVVRVRKRVEIILKTMKHEKFDEAAALALLNARTMEEVDILYAPFKPETKKTLAEIARQRGLEPVALQLLSSPGGLPSVNIPTHINLAKGLKTEEDVLNGIQHIIADIVSKNGKILDFVGQQCGSDDIHISSHQSAHAELEARLAEEQGRQAELSKYENYFDFNITLRNIASHHVLALNRGEKQDVLTVKVHIPKEVRLSIHGCCWETFFYKRLLDARTKLFLKVCVEDSYTRMIEPYMCRLIRSNLTREAEKESLSMFCSNVKSLLLTPPVRGKTIIGIDPGFYHGCKTAVISLKGNVLNTDVFYPHSNRRKGLPDHVKLKYMISQYGAEIIAIGNGTACRETENWLSNLIESNYFRPYDVKYCIVNESGASIWSVTKDAEEELPGMDPNIRSAVSIARRLQDPLLEYAKVEPKHLGVGMYQHDISADQLKKGLDGVFEECASFVGVDLNVCPEALLSKVSGLDSSSAARICDWRHRRGGFLNRKELLQIVDHRTYQQCAGFVKIVPQTCLDAVDLYGDDIFPRLNPLDRTIIHPESYDVAEQFLSELMAEPDSIGQQSFVNRVNRYMNFTCAEDIADRLDVDVSVMQLIIDAFKQLQDYDIREEFDKPLFKTAVCSFSELTIGQELTGRVCNLTGFGAFIDVGVGKDGLIHVSQMKGREISVGERVKVKVKTIDYDRKRLGLELWY